MTENTPLSQVEGTPQRAAAKRDWFVEVAPVAEPQPDTVESLLRTAALAAIEARRAYNEGNLTGTEAATKVVNLATPLTTSLRAKHGYPSEEAYALAVREAGFADSAEGTAQDAMALTFLEAITGACIAHEEGASEEAATFAIDAAIEDTASLVLGTGTEAA